ncbi:hypothetical protein VTL71DRAFT_10153 [Oculimacula yallundae]|uniref:F-box domain-containing protein n=1 Tax=Oculimacula yallundae TaxID=86028 RepID=A0ABR4BPR5_9HELO
MASTAPSSPSSSYSSSPSPTSTHCTCPPPKSPPTSPLITTTKDHLTTLPPELLLAIISYLPNSTSLLPLSQTNIFLQTFLLNTHAATICNTFITTRHMKAASILSASYQEGWFLPSHEAILSTERKIAREQVRKAGCGCVDCQSLLHSSRSTAASSSEISLASDSSTRCLKLPCFPKSPLRSSHQRTTCKAQHWIDSPWKLSLPGPMFLVFLEKYEWEIETRYAMLEAECKDADDAKREDEQRRFSFIVGNYSVRRFLEDVVKRFECDATLHQSPIQHAYNTWGLGRRLGGSMKSGWARSRRIFQLNRTKKANDPVSQSRSSTPPLFGEVPRPESDPTMVPKHDISWMKGLLWYYGLQHPLPQPDTKSTSNAEKTSEADDPQSTLANERHQEKVGAEQRTRTKDRDCMAIVRLGLGQVRSNMKLVFRRCKHVGAFQSLDG